MLAAGDLLLVDEAGLLDQDIARALLTVADEHQVRVALLGDRRQLPAVGRGGVLDHAARWADAPACVSVEVMHRFTRDIQTANGVVATVPDTDYAELSTRMRTGEAPEAIFDALHACGQIRVHPPSSRLLGWKPTPRSSPNPPDSSPKPAPAGSTTPTRLSSARRPVCRLPTPAGSSTTRPPATNRPPHPPTPDPNTAPGEASDANLWSLPAGSSTQT